MPTDVGSKSMRDGDEPVDQSKASSSGANGGDLGTDEAISGASNDSEQGRSLAEPKENKGLRGGPKKDAKRGAKGDGRRKLKDSAATNEERGDENDKENTKTPRSSESKSPRTPRNKDKEGRGRGRGQSDRSTPRREEEEQHVEPEKGSLGSLEYVLQILPFVKSDMPFGLGYFTKVNAFNNQTSALYDSKAAEGYSLNLRIRQLVNVGAELHMVRPYIVLHVVNKYTGRYLRSEQRSLQPMKTDECLMRECSTLPIWDQDLLIDSDFKKITDPDVLLLFELLDSRVPIKSQRFAAAGRNIKRVAWSFLLPCGADGQRLAVGVPDAWLSKDDKEKKTKKSKGKDKDVDTETGVGLSVGGADPETADTDENAEREAARNATKDVPLPLQLYAYQPGDMFGLDNLQRRHLRWHTYSGSSHFETFRDADAKLPASLVGPDGAFPDGSPEVYIQWRKQTLCPVKGSLLVNVGAREVVENSPRTKMIIASQIETPSGDNAQDESSKEDNYLNFKIAASARQRSSREPCVVPTKLLHRVDVGPEGTMSLAFSHKGNWLAVGACSGGGETGIPAVYPGSLYSLRIYDPDTGHLEQYTDVAHHGPIYKIVWKKDDSVLMTCSGDGTVRVWSLEMIRVAGGETKRKSVSIAPRRKGNRNASGDEPDESEEPAKLKEILSLTCIASLLHLPLCHVYSGLFQDFAARQTFGSDGKMNKTNLQIITGASDGHVRSWSGSVLSGRLGGDGPQDIATGTEMFDVVDEVPPHEGAIMDMTIDDRTRYLLTGDAVGNIIIWRQDPKGWYQMLRKFKKDDLIGSEIKSMQMHPDRTKGQLLVYAKPNILRTYSLSTYRKAATYPGAHNIGPGMIRSCFSADGTLVACGSEMSNTNSTTVKTTYRLRFWDTVGGTAEDSAITDIPLPYPLRSLDWHPTQHMVAAGMQGPGASLAIFVADKESNASQQRRRNNQALQELFRKDEGGADTNQQNVGNDNITGAGTASAAGSSNKAILSTVEKIRASRAAAKADAARAALRAEAKTAVPVDRTLSSTLSSTSEADAKILGGLKDVKDIQSSTMPASISGTPAAPKVLPKLFQTIDGTPSRGETDSNDNVKGWGDGDD